MLNSEAAINMCRRILTPCELAGIYQHFWGTYCLDL
jgi:hypothetical protein